MYALRPSQQPTVSLNYSQSIKKIIGLSDRRTIIPWSHRWRLSDFFTTHSMLFYLYVKVITLYSSIIHLPIEVHKKPKKLPHYKIYLSFQKWMLLMSSFPIVVTKQGKSKKRGGGVGNAKSPMRLTNIFTSERTSIPMPLKVSKSRKQFMVS